METRLAAPLKEFGDNIVDLDKPGYSTALGLVLMGFEKMEQEGTIYNTTTPIKYNTENETVTEEEKVSVTNNNPNNSEPKKAPKTPFSFKKLFGGFTNEGMFNDNDA
jgi:hypothetical protein